VQHLNYSQGRGVCDAFVYQLLLAPILFLTDGVQHQSFRFIVCSFPVITPCRANDN